MYGPFKTYREIYRNTEKRRNTGGEGDGEIVKQSVKKTEETLRTGGIEEFVAH